MKMGSCSLRQRSGRFGGCEQKTQSVFCFFCRFFGKSFYITLTSEESAKLRENIDNMLVIHVAEHFRVNLPFNTVRKSFDSHGDSK